MRIFRVILSTLIFISGAGFSQNKQKINPSENTQGLLSVDLMVEGVNQFAFDFYSHQKNTDKNLCFSPYSIVWALSLASLGAGGKTAAELQKVLNFPLSFLPSAKELKNQFFSDMKHAPQATQLFIAARLWINKEAAVKPSFLSFFESYFNEKPEFLDFKNLGKDANTINQWTSEKTNHKIHELVAFKNADDKINLILTSAMTMKGKWIHPFDRQLTKFLLFNAPRRKVNVEMMEMTGSFFVWKGDSIEILTLPYQQMENGVRLVMSFIVPKEGVDLGTIEDAFTLKQWKNWKKNLQQDKVRIVVPRFKVEQQIDLKASLRALGLNDVFGAQANFKAMTDQKDIYINQAVHEALLRVDEAGSDASGIVYRSEKAEGNNNEIVLNRPFIYIISDVYTGAIFFMGKILQL